MVTIWHNTGCGSSKNALEYLRSKGIEPEIYLYAKEKPTAGEIQKVLDQAGLKPSELLRPGEAKAEAAGLYAEKDESKILAAMAATPAFIQRPVVITAKGAVIARPKTRIDELL
jgi:arsenate reductase